jgi:fermentation-respiration switch protein FrsA (DUF1100 family)
VAAVVAESAFTDLDGMIARNFQQHVGLPPFPFAPVIVFTMQRRVGGDVAAVRPIDAVRRLGRRPVFLIDDLRDTVNPPNSGRRLYAAAAGPKELWLVAGSGHGEAVGAEPAEYARRVLDFYARYLARG